MPRASNRCSSSPAVEAAGHSRRRSTWRPRCALSSTRLRLPRSRAGVEPHAGLSCHFRPGCMARGSAREGLFAPKMLFPLLSRLFQAAEKEGPLRRRRSYRDRKLSHRPTGDPFPASKTRAPAPRRAGFSLREAFRSAGDVYFWLKKRFPQAGEPLSAVEKDLPCAEVGSFRLRKDLTCVERRAFQAENDALRNIWQPYWRRYRHSVLTQPQLGDAGADASAGPGAKVSADLRDQVL